MILRRFMKHVTDQNWFAVGLDLIVVIVGIFLGLQVQAAYETRQAQEEERQVVANLISDMERSISFYEYQLPIYVVQISQTSKVVEILEGGELKPEDVDDFEDGIFTYGRIQVLDPYVSAFHEGNLNRIQNNILRATIDNYLGNVRINKTRTSNIQTRIDQARSLTTIRAGARRTLTSDLIGYYDFEKLKNDTDYIVAVVNVNNFELLAMNVMQAVHNNSVLLLEALKLYQSGELKQEILFDLAAATSLQNRTRETP